MIVISLIATSFIVPHLMISGVILALMTCVFIIKLSYHDDKKIKKAELKFDHVKLLKDGFTEQVTDKIIKTFESLLNETNPKNFYTKLQDLGMKITESQAKKLHKFLQKNIKLETNQQLPMNAKGNQNYEFLKKSFLVKQIVKSNSQIYKKDLQSIRVS